MGMAKYLMDNGMAGKKAALWLVNILSVMIKNGNDFDLSYYVFSPLLALPFLI